MRHRHYRRRRAFRLGYRHNVIVPDSTAMNIVFPVDCETGQFNLSNYDPAMTGGVISRQEIANFLQGVEPTIKPIFNSTTLNFLRCYQKAHPFIMVALIIACILVVVFGFRVGIKAFVVLPVIIGVFMIFFCIVMIVNCMAVSEVKSLLGQCKDKVRPYINDKNDGFKSKGYFWVSPTQFPYWLELWNASAQGGMMNMSVQQQYSIPMQDMSYAMMYPNAYGINQPVYNGAVGGGGVVVNQAYYVPTGYNAGAGGYPL